MATSVSPGAPASTSDVVAQISGFMRQCSFEATRPAPKDIAALRDGLLPGTPVYLTMLPAQRPGECVDNACALREAGLTPVPHIAVRHLETLDAANELLAALSAKAGVTRVLLIGGDTKTPMGNIPNVLTLIESGLLQRNRITGVGVGGFPDGHPAMSEDELEANLVTKLAAIQNGGLDGHIVTQFVFDAEPVIKWVGWLRQRGLHVPVHIGLAGPTSLMAWLNFARKCGVKASAEALAKRSGLVRQAFKSVAPDPIIRSLTEAAATGELGTVMPHLFAFGGIGATVKWAQPAIRGAIALNGDGGFDTL